MKKITALALLGLALFSGGRVSAAPAASSLAEANTQYQTGDFKQAAELYEGVIKAGSASGAVYYNLANAYFRLGRKGKALVNYERALGLLPRDRNIRWNLDILRSVLQDRVEIENEALIFDFIHRINGYLSVDETAALFSLVLFMFFLAIFLATYLPKAGLAAQVFLVPCLIAAAVLFGFKYAEVKDPRAVVLDKEVYTYYGPSERETKAFLLHEGAEARVLDESKDWIYLGLKNKNAGWIRKKSCEII